MGGENSCSKVRGKEKIPSKRELYHTETKFKLEMQELTGKREGTKNVYI